LRQVLDLSFETRILLLAQFKLKIDDLLLLA
jgi:hypothetical protein